MSKVKKMRKDKFPNMITINRVKINLQASLDDRLAKISVGTIEEKLNAIKISPVQGMQKIRHYSDEERLQFGSGWDY